MGQKGNPVGIRLRINRDWDSNWFVRENYGNFLIEDLKIRRYVLTDFLKDKSFFRLEISNIRIVRVGRSLNVYISASRPGLLIGKKGQDIEKLRVGISKFVNLEDRKLNLNIVEIKRVDLDAKVVSQIIGKSLLGKVSYKRAAKQAMLRTIRAGAKGIKVKISGRLNGADIARVSVFKEGAVPLQTYDALVDYGKFDSMTKYGVIGVSVWIYKGTMTKKEFLENGTTAGARTIG